MFIDSHAHLFYSDFQSDLDEVLERARSAGVDAIVVPGTTAETSREAVELAGRFPWIHACVGYHPHEASEAGEKELSAVKELSQTPGVVAIGEIGLDFHYDLSPRERQREVFERQISLAIERNLPIVVHTRESTDESIETVKRLCGEHPEWRNDGNGSVKGARGVFHCFTGSAEQARELFSLGFFVSFPGIVTFKNSPVLKTLEAIGYDSILLETDSPFLTPVPFRGKRNEPSYIPFIANKIAEVLHATPGVVAERTAANTRQLFSLTTDV